MLKQIKKWQLLLPVIIGMLPINGFAQLKEKKFVIKGDMTALAADSIPKMVYLTFDSYLHRQPDSTVVVNGYYTFTGTLPMPALVSIRRKKNSNAIAGFVADTGEQKVVTLPSIRKRDSATARRLKMPMTSIVDSTVVKGSAADSIYQNDIMNPLKSKLVALPNRATLGFAGLLAKIAQLQDEQIVNNVKAHPHSLIAPMLVIKVANRNDRNLTDSLLKLLPKRAQPLVAKEIKKIFEASDAEMQKTAGDRKKPGPAIGTTAPVFIMADTLEKPVSLSDFKGKYVLLDFWASWCAPCRMENPNIVSAYRQFKDKGFEVVGISLDAASQKAAWIAAIKDDGLHWTQLSDLQGWKNAAAQLYGVKFIPQNFLIDPNGIIIEKGLQGSELKMLLSRLLK
jgi:peroxiredoxin